MSTGAALLVATEAEAQVATEWQGSASAGLGVTTNVANTAVPDRLAPKGTIVPEWDGFGSITPAIQLVVETPRTTNTFVYGLDYHYYFRHHEANAVSNSLSYALGATVSKSVDFSLGITAAQTQMSAFNFAGSGQTAQAIPTPGGNNYLLTGVVNQSFTVAITDLDSFSQGASFAASDNIPTGDVPKDVTPPSSTQTYLASGTLSYGHQFRSDSMSFILGTDVGAYPDLPGGGAIIPQHTDIIHRAELTWHHEWANDWSTTAGAGALVAYQGADLHPIGEPIGSASIDYSSGRGTAGLTYSHAAEPNLTLGETMFGDNVALRGLMPLKYGLDVSGAVDFLASRPLLSQAQGGGFGDVTYSFVIDATLGYDFKKQPLRLEGRYALSRQFPGKSPPCSATEPPPCSKPIPGQIVIPEIRRQDLSIVLTYYFPHPPPPGTHGPSPVPLPAVGSGAMEVNHPPITREQLSDEEKQGAKDKKKQFDKANGVPEPAPGENP